MSDLDSCGITGCTCDDVDMISIEALSEVIADFDTQRHFAWCHNETAKYELLVEVIGKLDALIERAEFAQP